MESRSTAPAAWRVIAAFIAVYIIWGSTYLGIQIAIETMPPFLMAGVRFLISGAILYAITAVQGEARPSRIHWKSAAIIGALLLLGGNGGVSWAEQRVPSSLAALLVAMSPLWMVLINWLRPGGTRPSAGVFAGVLVGMVGIYLLVGPTDLSNMGAESGGMTVDPIGLVAILIATMCWAAGSVYSKSAPMPQSALQMTAMEMLAGGGLLLLVATVTGDWSRFDISAVSDRSLLALVYLVIFGAIVAYTCYVWLLKVQPTARVATYAYVNPVVAVFLGWAFANEPITPRTLVAAAVIVGAVVLITSQKERKAEAAIQSPAYPVQSEAVQASGSK